jgi:L-rhamnose-H+ transport protein
MSPMEPQFARGLAYVILGGAIQGAYVLPLKYTPHWARENTWLVYSSCAMFILPWALALSATTNLLAVFRASSWNGLLLVSLCGLGWGLGNVLYGLGVMALGIGLGAALILGITASLGSLLPLILHHPQGIFSRAGLLTILGVVVMMAGVAVCARAGNDRDRRKFEPGRFLRGALICVASGVLSAFLNFGFILGAQIVAHAQKAGNSPVIAVYPVLALLLTGGFLGNFAYCLYLLTKGKSWRRFRIAGAAGHWWLGALMGLLLFGGYVLYGIGVAKLGALGPSVGWSVFLSMFVITANMAGMLTGEWRDAGARARRTMLTGSLILLVAVVILGIANRG